MQSRGGRYVKNMISRFFLEISRFMVLSRFFVMLVLLFCKLSEYSQTNFPIIKPFKVRKKEWQIFRQKWAKIKNNCHYFIFLIKK